VAQTKALIWSHQYRGFRVPMALVFTFRQVPACVLFVGLLCGST
jgi:hypothetical protein